MDDSTRAALQAEICELMASGIPLKQICRRDGMPSHVTVYAWAHKDEDFNRQLQRARIQLCEAQQDEIDDFINHVTPENARAAQVRLSALTWKLEKLLPKLYGAKPAAQVTVNDNRTQVVITDERRAELQERLKRLTGVTEVTIATKE